MIQTKEEQLKQLLICPDKPPVEEHVPLCSPKPFTIEEIRFLLRAGYRQNIWSSQPTYTHASGLIYVYITKHCYTKDPENWWFNFNCNKHNDEQSYGHSGNNLIVGTGFLFACMAAQKLVPEYDFTGAMKLYEQRQPNNGSP